MKYRVDGINGAGMRTISERVLTALALSRPLFSDHPSQEVFMVAQEQWVWTATIFAETHDITFESLLEAVELRGQQI